MTRLGWFSFGVAIVLAGCAYSGSTGYSGAGSTTAGGSVQATPATPAPDIAGAWTVDEVGGQPVLDRSATSLTFDADGRVSGSTGCNALTGSVTIAERRITFSPLATTRRACAEDAMAQERRFLEAMGNVRSYALDDGGAMRLLAEDGQPLARLTRAK